LVSLNAKRRTLVRTICQIFSICPHI
jgi:hypothetical protein